jgi:hypothetical protein
VVVIPLVKGVRCLGDGIFRRQHAPGPAARLEVKKTFAYLSYRRSYLGTIRVFNSQTSVHRYPSGTQK